MPHELAWLLTRAIAAEPAEEAADGTRTRILDAALEEATSVGVDRMTVEDVVRRSGLGRMTVYRRYPKRDDLVDALVVRECRRFLAVVAEGLDEGDTPEEATAIAFAAAMRFVRLHPLLVRVANGDPGAVIATAAARERLVLGLGVDFIAARLSAARPDGDPRAIRRTADIVARLFLTYVAMPPDDPDPRDDAALRAYARDVLAPLIALGLDAPAEPG